MHALNHPYISVTILYPEGVSKKNTIASIDKFFVLYAFEISMTQEAAFEYSLVPIRRHVSINSHAIGIEKVTIQLIDTPTRYMQ